jgi:hypothetical protein
MDPRARIELKGILRELKAMGKTIIISSHILTELAQVCDMIGIIEKGKMVIDGNVDDIMKRITGKTVMKIKVLNQREKAVNILKEQPLVDEIIQEGEILEVTYGGEEHELWKLLKVLVNQEIPVISFAKAEGNLEKIFMEVTQGEEILP